MIFARIWKVDSFDMLCDVLQHAILQRFLISIPYGSSEYRYLADPPPKVQNTI